MMATYQVLRWGDIPAGVKAREDGGEVREQLPIRFQQAIDAVATATGRVANDTYLAGWTWDEPTERPGTAADVARAVAQELEAQLPADALRNLKEDMVERLGRPTDNPQEPAQMGPVNTEGSY